MSQIIASLSGAPGAASTANSYYQNAANQLAGIGGSPVAQIFGREEQAADQPGFTSAQQAMAGTLAAQGITNSGAAKADYSNLFSNQSATLANNIAPLYQQAAEQYGNLISQEPGAEIGAYNNAENQFTTGVGDLASAASMAFGGPPIGGGGGTTGADGNFYSSAPGAGTTEYTTSSPYGT